MSHNFGNNSHDGYQSRAYEYEPEWEKDVDYNPDHQRSSSAMFIEEDGSGDIRWVLQVKGLGVIIMHAATDWEDESGRLKFKGLGTFTKGEIGYAPTL